METISELLSPPFLFQFKVTVDKHDEENENVDENDTDDDSLKLFGTFVTKGFCKVISKKIWTRNMLTFKNMSNMCDCLEVKKEVQGKTLNMVNKENNFLRLNAELQDIINKNKAVVQEAQNLGLTLPLIPDNAVSKTRDIQVEEFEYNIYYYGQQFKKNN
ncbi:hypothetical protein C2G38_2206004 [Gigaspora rosea]|uniref:Uncharacterized protein n=1 Tax=Gigaspora rosea TaxID=44941 RepID=A0A397UP52_9GLOM|nr:hypothetical protein C2G38_2206004 [Gigaspora rosea]